MIYTHKCVIFRALNLRNFPGKWLLLVDTAGVRPVYIDRLNWLRNSFEQRFLRTIFWTLINARIPIQSSNYWVIERHGCGHLEVVSEVTIASISSSSSFFLVGFNINIYIVEVVDVVVLVIQIKFKLSLAVGDFLQVIFTFIYSLCRLSLLNNDRQLEVTDGQVLSIEGHGGQYSTETASMRTFAQVFLKTLMIFHVINVYIINYLNF